jgi:hypothetical protein
MPKTDEKTDAATIIEYSEQAINDGNAFFVMYSVADLGAMTTPNDTITLSFATPDTKKWAHFDFFAKGTAGWRVRLIEAPSGGVATPTGQLNILNNDRNSSTASTILESTGSTAAEVDYDATLATGGTTLWDEYLGVAGGPQFGGAGAIVRRKFVLKQDTVYQLSLYGTDANPATLYMGWNEHINLR